LQFIRFKSANIMQFRLIQGVLAVAMLAWSLHAQAVTLVGTVTGPDGPVASARVIAEQSGGTAIETVTDVNGQYAMEVPAGFYPSVYAESADIGSGLIGERVNNIDISGDKEIRLFLVDLVTLAGTVQLPPDFQGTYDMAFVGLERLGLSWDPRNQTERNFEIQLPAGVYSILVSPSCKAGDPPPTANVLGLCHTAFYLGHVAVDASKGSVEDIVVPVSEYRSPVHDFPSPVADLIQVGPANARGVAMVTGQAGATSGPSRIRIVNLQTQLVADGVSYEDGSFSIPAFAPPGSHLAIVHDPLGLGEVADFAAQTLLRVPPTNEPAGGFAALLREDSRQIRPEGLYNSIRSVGAASMPQIHFSGVLDDRNWSPGATIAVGGEFRIFFRDAEHVEAPVLHETIHLAVVLEQLFDESGAQFMTNPQAAGSTLTTTGYPILRGGWMDGAIGSADHIGLSSIQFDGDIQVDPDGYSGNWSAVLEVPNSLPQGTYGLSFAGFVELEPVEKHFEDVFVREVPNRLVSHNGIAATVTVGSPSPPRLGWVLGMNELSDGTRGIVAKEDRGAFEVSGQIAHNGQAFVLPRFDPLRRTEKTYRLEPGLPLMGAANDGFLPPPRVPLAFPSGSLSVVIQKPDGGRQNLGTAPFRQLVTQGVSALHGARPHDTSNIVRLYPELTTLDDRFQHRFDQYGPHTVTMSGWIEDVQGNRYEGGGVYEVHVAKPLDLETGVFPNTPFEVGDAYSPTVIVQPGVTADVTVTLTVWPESDESRKVVRVFAGEANRFGYFHAEGIPHVFTEHGEYRVDIEASWWDKDGAYWFGALSWGNIIETPNSPLIAHGARGMHETARDASPLWYFEDDLGFGGESTHMFFPFSNGDIMWSLDTTDPRFNSSASGIVTVQDTQGDFADLVKARSRLPLNWEASTNPALSEAEMDLRAQIGEIPLFSSNPKGPAALYWDDAQTHHAYFYSGAGRPGVRVREFAGNQLSANRYWRFNDAYYYQAGNGINGDLPNDFKFLFGGAVYRAPEIDFHYYGAHGSLWVSIPNGSEPNTRIFPPFQGNGGGPSGGPIMTLKGEDIDMFFHVLGTRPGAILEVGDVASFAGQLAPTLPSHVGITVTSPSGAKYDVSGKSNKVGYFYVPAADFRVTEPGVWTVAVNTWFDGISSAGQVQQPYPSGSVLGSNEGQYRFYVVDPSDQPLGVGIPAQSWVEPGKGPIDIPLMPPGELTDVTVHRTTVMPGFILESAESQNLTYTYDAPSLHGDFPNLDIVDADSRYGVDTITMSFLVTGKNGDGNTVHRARQILIQGEELLAPKQTTPVVFRNSFERVAGAQ
jgi:hypothetical protein